MLLSSSSSSCLAEFQAVSTDGFLCLLLLLPSVCITDSAWDLDYHDLMP